MSEEFLPFCRPFISEEEIEAVGDVLRSGWITTGPKTAEFEKSFQEMLGCGGAVAVVSGTAGMHVALEALDIGPGDEVITPSMTWVSTVNLIVLAGATPVFVDVDRGHLMAGAAEIEPKITKKTKAIIPVHFAGAAADIDPILDLAEAHTIPVIEDSAHAAGTLYKGRPVGRTGTSVFSFQAIKNLTTAEGGMVCSDDEKFLERVKQLKFHGLGVDSYDRETLGRAPQAEVLAPGYKYNFTDISAAIGLGQLDRLAENNRQRARLAQRYLNRLSEVEAILPLEMPDWSFKHAWHLFVIRLDDDRAGMDRNTLMAKLKERGIGTGIHFRAAHLHRYFRETMGFGRGLLPHTEWNSDRMVSLPLFPQMSLDDVDRVVDAIKEVLEL
jgi:UDP-4-amino-4-deoxy-L-arabinose-oxoglutarate aminotransferase